MSASITVALNPNVFKALVPHVCFRCGNTIEVDQLFTRSANPNKVTYVGIKYCQCRECAPVAISMGGFYE